VEIYTDGACSGNPGPGGWAALLRYNGAEKEVFGSEPSTTNNRMEMSAAIFGLGCLKEPCSVTLYSDSAYLVDAINKGWLRNWRRNGWQLGRDGKGGGVRNVDLWQSLGRLMEVHDVAFVKVRGHADNRFNNRCDALATGAAAECLRALGGAPAPKARKKRAGQKAQEAR
jgi:ribonuclease HI